MLARWVIYFGAFLGNGGHERCWRTQDAMGISRDLTPLTRAPQPAAWRRRAPTWLPTKVGTEVLLTVHPRTSGCFLSISKSGSGVIAKCFPTLPLRCFPFQHRGKYRVHNFNEYFLNDWMFMLEICRGIDYTILHFVCCWWQYFLFGRVSFPALPYLLEILCSRVYHVHMGGFCFLQNIYLYLIKLNTLTITGWHAGCCSELTLFFFQTCKLLPKALTITCQGDAPCLFLFCGNIVVSTRMLQSEGLTIKNLHSDLHGLSGLSKLVPCLCCASCEAHCRVQLLKPGFLGWHTTSPLFSSPCGHLALFQWFHLSSAAFQKQKHLTIVSTSPSMLSLCCISPNVTLFDGLLFKSKNMAILMQQTHVKVGIRDRGTFYSHCHSLIKYYYLFTGAFWPVAQAWL